MAVSKNKKGASGGAHQHIRARMAYLHRASTYLFSQQQSIKTPTKIERENATPQTSSDTPKEQDQNQEHSALRACIPRHYINQMRGVSLKAQQRLSIETKRSFCKRCDLPLVPGVTCTEEIRNASKGRKKPWADVLVIRCSACETEKRIPQNKPRSRKLKDRRQEKEEPQDHHEVS